MLHTDGSAVCKMEMSSPISCGSAVAERVPSVEDDDVVADEEDSALCAGVGLRMVF